MKNVISITEARKRLPGIVKSLKHFPDTVYQITVHNEIVAEIKTPPKIKPGEAATKMLEIRKRLRHKGKRYKTAVSENIKGHLYVAEGKD
ncbi:MAG: hypothetical protein HY755_00495 [Nitrospirae bacterium]|nr:hypothetical protein [Nitrospirota bacterium]